MWVSAWAAQSQTLLRATILPVFPAMKSPFKENERLHRDYCDSLIYTRRRISSTSRASPGS